ncbi:MAG: hypothetical protein J6K38_05480 [Alistipes sp.]|nr:hypothetical protein [Alistipes sp.]
MKRSILIATVASVLFAVAGNAQTTVSGTIDGHDYVDLGLSVKWATCNVGASSPEDPGDYFAWGETMAKSTYTRKNSKTLDKLLVDVSGNSKYDAACANWGGSWRIPTKEEMQELIDKCTWTWTTQGGYNGYKVISTINGNSIFLPATGKRYNSSIQETIRHGFYWSSTPDGYRADWAYNLEFGSSYHRVESYVCVRRSGQCVRPVSD